MYNNLNPKYKSFLFFIVKLTIVVSSLYFIFDKVVQNDNIKFNEFTSEIKSILFQNIWTIPLLILLTFFNWFFEIWKWKILANIIIKTPFLDATIQSLSALTVSLFTPNRIGEYGGKIMYFQKNKGKIILLNLIGNLSQFAITILFGIVGVYFFISNYEIDINPYRIRRIGYILAFSLLLFIPNKSRKLKLFSYIKLDKILDFTKNIRANTHVKIIALSSIRYLIFSHQFYFLLLIFGIEESYVTLMYLIFSMYIIASFIPSISLFDWAIKGTVAIYIFSYIQAPKITIITITLLMWILNFALPSMIGSYYVLNFKLPKN